GAAPGGSQRVGPRVRETSADFSTGAKKVRRRAGGEKTRFFLGKSDFSPCRGWVNRFNTRRSDDTKPVNKTKFKYGKSTLQVAERGGSCRQIRHHQEASGRDSRPHCAVGLQKCKELFYVAGPGQARAGEPQGPHGS